MPTKERAATKSRRSAFQGPPRQEIACKDPEALLAAELSLWAGTLREQCPGAHAHALHQMGAWSGCRHDQHQLGSVKLARTNKAKAGHQRLSPRCHICQNDYILHRNSHSVGPSQMVS